MNILDAKPEHIALARTIASKYPQTEIEAIISELRDIALELPEYVIVNALLEIGFHAKRVEVITTQTYWEIPSTPFGREKNEKIRFPIDSNTKERGTYLSSFS